MAPHFPQPMSRCRTCLHRHVTPRIVSRRHDPRCAEPLERRVLLSASATLPGGTVFVGHTYHVVEDTQTGWNDAQAAAQAAGGHLVTINSPEEQAFLETLLADSGAPTGSYHIGGHVTSTDPLRFGWVTDEPFSYTHWFEGEPNSAFKPPGSEPVMAMLWTEGSDEPTAFRRGFWNDEIEPGYRPGESIFADVNQSGYIVEVDSADQVYEAERAAITGAIVATTHRGFGGDGYVDYQHRSGDAVEFTVNVPTAGRYDLGFRYANGGVADRSMGLSVNGTDAAGGVNFARTGSWRTWNTATRTASLAAGSNTIRLVATGQSGPNLDSLSLHAVPPPAPVTYQAEDAALLGPLARSNHAHFTGTGFADYQNLRDDAVEFTIDAAQGGNYALDFRYANGSTNDRPLQLSVDGQVAAASVSFAPTGSWSTWDVVTQSVVLTAGSHKVRLSTLGHSGPNLDSLTVRPV